MTDSYIIFTLQDQSPTDLAEACSHCLQKWQLAYNRLCDIFVLCCHQIFKNITHRLCATTADFSMRGSDAGVVINGVKIRKGRPIHLPCGCSLSFPPYASKYLFQKMNGNWVFLCDLLVRPRLWRYSCIILTTTRIRNLPVNSQQKMLVKRPRFEDNTCDTRCPVIISLPSARYSDDISIFASLLCMEFITRF